MKSCRSEHTRLIFHRRVDFCPNSSQYTSISLKRNVNKYRGADKSLARPGRKQATATKLVTFVSHSKKKKQKVVRPTRSPRQQWPPRRTKYSDLSTVFSVGSKDLSAPLYILYLWKEMFTNTFPKELIIGREWILSTGSLSRGQQSLQKLWSVAIQNWPFLASFFPRMNADEIISHRI